MTEDGWRMFTYVPKVGGEAWNMRLCNIDDPSENR